MPSRLTILATTAIVTVAFAAPAAFAGKGSSGGHSVSAGSHSMSTGPHTMGMSMGSHPSMGMGMAHMGGMHQHHHGHFLFHHGHFFFGSVGYDPYYYADYDDFFDDESCPPVRRRVQTEDGLRWRTVRACAY
jgi:hypothetical protein